MPPILGLIILFLGTLAALVVWLVWQMQHPDKTEAWPVVEGTIQSVGEVYVPEGRGSYLIDVGDFSYNINNEYYSGRLAISSSYSDGARSPRGLIHQKIQLRYDPAKPEKFLVPPQESEGFNLGPYNVGFASDVGPIDLNIDKL